MPRLIQVTLLLFAALTIYCPSLPLSAAEQNQVAIIIDDFGGNVKGVDDFLTGDIPITAAIMPFQPFSTEQAERAHQAGLEVIIHMPMEPKRGKASWLGPKAITSQLSDDEIRTRVREAIADVPHAKGINNHMGSKIVENEHIVRVILEEVRAHNFYVIDSGTSPRSRIPEIAEELGIPYATRHIFLDDTLSSRAHVRKQLTSLLKVVEKQHKAIGIGHVGIKGNETFAGISHALPIFKEKRVEIVPASHLLDSPIDKDYQYFWQQQLKEE